MIERYLQPATLLGIVLLVGACGGDGERAAPTTAQGETAPKPPLETVTDEATTSGGTTTAPVRPAPPPPAATPTGTTTATEPAPPRATPFVVGAVDDAARHPGPVLGQLAAAGFDSLAITSYWDPGRSRPAAEELATLRDVTRRARSRGLRVFLAVFHRGSATTPLTAGARRQFASYTAAIVREVPAIRDVIVGNEPNINRFWLPQFGPDGESDAPAAYLALLAATFDAIKAADADVFVWGGALAPRGSDRPFGRRPTHSPGRFIRELGRALRASGRSNPPMDGFAFHPYPETSSTPPDVAHPNPRSRTIGLADVDRLEELLREAFGRELPILYSELGVETRIPPAKAHLYEGQEPADPVDEPTQADFYRRALELAACQEGVVGVLLFHSHDEPFLTGFQSGLYYVDGSPKQSLPAVRAAIESARNGCVR